jgi:hypothetical protein
MQAVLQLVPTTGCACAVRSNDRGSMAASVLRSAPNLVLFY